MKVCYPQENEEENGLLDFGPEIPPYVAVLVNQKATIKDLDYFVSNFDKQ